jgi:photosystem II stability/assembly factor-like uncharacterized protein
MENIYKITVTGSNNVVKIEPGQLAYLRKDPFSSNTLTGSEIAPGIFSFDVLQTGYYQLWTGSSLTSIANNQTFSTSVTGKMQFGNDINFLHLTGTTGNLQSQIASLTGNYNSLSSIATRFTTLSSSVVSLSSSVTSISASVVSLSSSVTSLSALNYPVILKRNDGINFGYTSVTAAISAATTGDVVNIYKSLSANILLKDLVDIYIDTGVVVDSGDYSLPTITDNGVAVKSKITGYGTIQNSYNCVNANTNTFIKCFPDALYIADSLGTIFRSASLGDNRNDYSVSSLSANRLSYSHFIDAATGYTCGSSGTLGRLFKTTNSGSTWNMISDNSFTGGRMIGVYFIDSVTGFAIINSASGIARTVDGGLTWTALPITVTGTSTTTIFGGMSFANNLIGNFSYYNSATGLNYKTVDGGASWSLENSITGKVSSLKYTDSATGYITNNSGVLFKTTNTGTTWALHYNFGSANTLVTEFQNSATGYSMFADSTLYRTVNGGGTWTSIATVSPDSSGYSLNGKITFINNSSTGFITGGRRVLKTVDNGVNWITIVGAYNSSTSVFSNVTTYAQAIYLANSLSEVDIQAETIWGYGANTVNSFNGVTIDNVARKLWLKANTVYSLYNCGIYNRSNSLSNNSTTAINFDIKYVYTGLPTRRDAGSSVIVNYGGGYIKIDEINAYCVGHTFSSRSGELTIDIMKARSWNNNNNNYTYGVYIAQGTGTQKLNLFFDELLSYDGQHGQSMPAFSVEQGIVAIHGNRIYSQNNFAVYNDTGSLAGDSTLNVKEIVGAAGVYNNNPKKVIISNASICAFGSNVYNHCPIVLTNNNVQLLNCVLYNVAGQWSIQDYSSTGATVKLINVYSNSAMDSSITAKISNLNVSAEL